MIRHFDPCDFILRGIDPVTETVCVEWRVRIEQTEKLREILGADEDQDPGLDNDYWGISTEDMQRIGGLCQPTFVPRDTYGEIGRPSPLYDGVPYLIHTNLELPLMLDGWKPLAVFGYFYPSEWHDDYLAPFERFAAESRLVRRVIDTPMPHLKARHPHLDGERDIFFALPGEEWRIDAYIELMKRNDAWGDSEERQLGSLLGYED